MQILRPVNAPQPTSEHLLPCPSVSKSSAGAWSGYKPAQPSKDLRLLYVVPMVRLAPALSRIDIDRLDPTSLSFL